MTEHWAIDIQAKAGQPKVGARRSADGSHAGDRLRAFFVSSEIFPLAKTGGLADVSAALPAALATQGVDPLLFMPGYPQALETAVHKRVLMDLSDRAGFGEARIIAGWTPDTSLPVWLLDAPALFDRDGGPYQDRCGQDWDDNAQRFGLFSRAAATMAANWLPDVVHLNDWQAGLTALFLQQAPGPRPATLFTVHNMAFQGVFGREAVANLGIAPQAMQPDGIEYFGNLSFLKAGLRYADRLTTVSPTYAREILTEEFGFGLQGLLQARRGELTGVLNGIDDSLWNPSTDSHLPRNFTARDLSGKRVCKTQLQRELGLAQDAQAPLVVFASRLTEQKMVDCLPQIVPLVLAQDAQLAIVGEGDRHWEENLGSLNGSHPGRVAVRIGHDESLAHRLHAGADILLAPARFEPCGLVQMYGMRYGTLPVVRSVGGLADTVVDATARNLEAGTATGFAFAEANAQALAGALDRALTLWHQPIAWRRLQARAMSRDFSWTQSATQYRELYCHLAGVPLELGTHMPAAADPMDDEEEDAAMRPAAASRHVAHQG